MSIPKAEGALSITVSRGLRKGGIKGMQQLTKKWGVPAKLYKLKDQTHPKSQIAGFYDDIQDYEDKPYFEGLVLIPSVFRRRNTTNLSALDPFIDSDIFMYIPATQKIHLHTLVVVKNSSNQLENYRVIESHGNFNEAGLIVGRYAIAPVMSFDVEKNREIIEETIKEESKRAEDKLLDNYSSTEGDYSKNSEEFIYSPIK